MAKARFIPPDAYPQMVSRSDAAKMSRALRSGDTVTRGAKAIQNAGQALREAVRDYVRELEEAMGDYEITADRAHEIRGFAETAGLRATGRIADGLCRYFEEMRKLGAAPDAAVIALHVSALVRAANAEDEASRMSDVVAKELAALVSHKLAETKTDLSG
jgi:TATA-box binding protein (TBP) (component of TFIID and TFIIIB)